MSELPLDAAGRRRPSATLPQVFTPAARRATRDALPGRPNPRPRRSSRSCAALVTRARSPTAPPDGRAVARRPAHLRGAYARRGRPGPAPRVAAGAARQARPTPRGWHRRPGLRAARTMAPDPRLAADRAAVMRRQRPSPTRGRPCAPAATRSQLRRVASHAGARRCFAPHQLRPRARGRDGPRGRAADRHPAPARPHPSASPRSTSRHRNAGIIDTVHARRAPMVPVHRPLAP
jgi:hypothetical protein